MNIFLLALIFTPVFVLLAVKRNRRERSDERSATTEVEVNDKGAFRVLADGRREEVDWNEGKR